ncbi:MAG: TrmH family RNA methyltransferase [Patescibacteria group bacterium]
MRDVSLILLDIRSSENVGSMFRTADAAGAVNLYLVGYTPAPADRFGRPNVKLEKSALGAEKRVPWERIEDADALLRSLKVRGVRVIALEQDPRSIPYDSFVPPGPVALIMGNEVGGVPSRILDVADIIMEIPMRGEKESLNVAVAAGIALYALTAGA